MSTVIRPVGYVGTLQRLIWNFPSATAQAYLWGGGGGGGGDDGTNDPGGNGSGGAFARIDFTINSGDTLDIAVGQGGQGGLRPPQGTSTQGLGGTSLRYPVFNTRNQPDVVPVTNSAWNYFMNAHAVWDPGGSGVTPIFRTYTVSFPVTGYYVFQYSVDNTMSVDFDGVNIISYSGFTADPVPFVTRLVTAGNHTVNITASNSSGPAGVALTIDASYSGADGGLGSGSRTTDSGGGGGGGGGGATVLLINNQVRAVAGGGGGGGGGGASPGTAPNAPGPWGWPTTASNVTLAQEGQSANQGGGGGGGGGGQSAGNGGRRGGATPSDPGGSGDITGTGGSYGESATGGETGIPVGRTPGGSTQSFYAGSSRGGAGGSVWPHSTGEPGQPGYAVFVFDISGLYVRDAGLWSAVRNQYIRHQDAWQQINNIYIRQNDEWQQVYGTSSPVFTSVSGNWGRLDRRRGRN